MAIDMITTPPWRLFKISEPYTARAGTYAVDSAEDGYDVAFMARGGHAGADEANGRLIAASPLLRDACRAVLLFHSGADWNEERRNEWHALTGEGEATTKILCDTVRRALAGID